MLKKLIYNKTLKQTSISFFSQVFGLVISFFVVMIMTKKMGTDVFGVYSSVIAIITFISIFFEFGFLSSISKMLAKNDNYKKEKELLGLSIISFLIISFLFFVTIYITSQFFVLQEKIELGNIIKITSIVTWAISIPFFLQLILKGVNKIEKLSFLFILNKVVSSLILILLIWQNNISIIYAIYAISFANLLTFVIFVLLSKAKFNNFSTNYKELLVDVKEYGFHKYVGKIIETSTFHLDKIMLLFFIGTTSVGFYGSALTFSNPIKIFSNSLSTSKFKEFSNGKPIKKVLIKINWLIVAIAIIGANCLGFIVVKYYWGKEFNSILYVLPILSIAMGFNSLYQPYANWISSNGFGKYIKKRSLYSSFTNLTLNIILIPIFGLIGAAVASLIAEGISYLLNVFFYRKGLDKLKINKYNLNLK